MMRRHGRIVSGKGGGDKKIGHDPEYEEVGPVCTINLKHTPDGRGDGKHCEVCGSAQAAVRCESCSGQVFCPACDDVFHKHPRRTAHIRKNMEGVRPPLPPKTPEGMPSVPPPQPPPRRNKRGLLGTGGGFGRKDQLSGSMMSLRHIPHDHQTPLIKQNNASEGSSSRTNTIMGSLKRFMGSRPLPPPPAGSDNRGGTTINGSTVHSNLIRSITSPNLADDSSDSAMAVAIPQTVVDLSNNNNNINSNSSGSRMSKYPAPLPPPTPPYPSMNARQPLGLVVTPPSGQQQQNITVQGHQRKLSLQQSPPVRDDKRSMIDGGSWNTPSRNRSQSVSDDQWSQMLAAQSHPVVPMPPPHDPPPTREQRTSTGRPPPARGMMSSASVCNLNTLAQPQQQMQQQPLPPQPHQQQLIPHMGGMHQSGSFQQLNLVPYNGGMMWSPPCDMCHGPAMYPPPSLPSHGMKRAASNISMNMSSASSDVTGYPWQAAPHMHHPHMHHPMYPGCYPPHPHHPPPPGSHIMPGSMQGSSISIPDSMAAFSKVSSSPAPSVRSSSRRSHKSNKSRSFSTADLSNRRNRSTHPSDSEESTSSLPSIEDDLHSSKPGYPGGPLAWQCDHCTFINQAGSRVCGMCSKSQVSSSHSRAGRRNSERRRSERRYVSRRNDNNDEDDREPSDYDNDGKHTTTIQYNSNSRDNTRRDKSSKSSIASSRSKKKLRRRGGSSGSASDIVDEIERQLSDMKVSKSRSEYDGLSSKLKEREKDRDRERGSRRREGKLQRRD